MSQLGVKYGLYSCVEQKVLFSDCVFLLLSIGNSSIGHNRKENVG